MLTSKDIFNKIDLIVEKAYLDFTYLILGDSFFTPEQKIKIESLGLIVGARPLLELLYILVRNRPTEGYRKDKTLLSLLDEIAQTGVLPIINDAHQATIDTAKADINEAIQNTKNDVVKQVKQKIIEVNNDYRNEIVSERLTTIPNIEKKKNLFGKILIGALAGIGLATQSNFTRAFTSALTDTINHATIDTATTVVRGDPIVYKEVINDSHLCQWCDSFYNEGGKPKEYKLSELVANGSNDGKPKSAWRPVVGAVHPRCRCQLHYKS